MECNTENSCPIFKVVKNKYFKKIFPPLLGALLGYLYYYFIGCTGNSCPITSNPWSTIFFGALIGLIWSFDRK